MSIDVSVNAFDEQRRDLEIMEFRMLGQVQSFAKIRTLDAKGEIRSQMRHQIAPDQSVGIGQRVQSDPGVFNGARREEHFAFIRNIDRALIGHNPGHSSARSFQPDQVSIVHNHKAFFHVFGVGAAAGRRLRFTLGQPRSFNQQLHAVEFIEPEETWARSR